MQKTLRILIRSLLKTTSILVLVSVPVLASAPVLAEAVKVPVGSQAADKKSSPSPARGSSQAQVKLKYGEPVAERGPVGQPPISAWEYEHYVVYFEYDKVLHSVYKR